MPSILIADDQRTTRLLLESLLTAEGYEVVQAGTGAGALKLLAARPVDVVLLDVILPDMNGFEVCRAIRADSRFALLPVVFVTSLDDRDARVRGTDVGGDDFLTKPIDPMELRARIRNLLRVRDYHELIARQRDQLEIELEKTRAQLLHADRLANLGTLATGVGHELNNILMVLHGSLELIRADLRRSNPVSEADLANIEAAAEHIRVHARHLLELGRPGPDRSDLIDLREVVRTTLGMLHTAGKTKRLNVAVVMPGHPVLVDINRTRVEQVLVNLIGNAADALESVSERQPEIRVEVRHETASNRVTCCVGDNGTGIPEEHLETVFEPYFTTKAPGRGTGLGLSVVRSIVESYGGAIRVESRPGAGTTFTFDLPAAAGAQGLAA